MVSADTESNDAPQDGGVRQSRRNRTPREMYVPSVQGRLYANGKDEGGGLPTAKKRSTEGGTLGNQFSLAGYCTKRGVIKLQMHSTSHL